MPAFLSAEWVAGFNAAVSGQPAPDPGPDAGLAAQGGSFTMAQIVEDGPDGTIATLLRVEPTGVTMELTSGHASADVTVRLSWDDAVALSSGVLSPAEALAAGRIRVRGDLSVLAAAQQTLVAFQPLLGDLQAATTY